jgi:tetratricopeptide (TPR) repeat protein
MDYNSEKRNSFPIVVTVLISILVISFFVLVGGLVYFIYNPDAASIPGRLIGRFIYHKVSVVGHGIYLQTIQDPDKDKDGLSDLAETEVYKTDHSKFSSNGSKLNDGEYIYSIYKKAFDTNDEKLVNQYQENLEVYKQSTTLSDRYKNLGEMSLDDAFNLRGLEKYNFYVGVPNDVIQLVKDALVARQRGDYDESLKLIQGALNENPESAILKYHLGLTYYRLKQDEKALAVYESIENDPAVNSPLLYRDLAAANYALGNYDKFVSYLELSIKKFPEDLDQYLVLSSYYREKNQLDKAEAVVNDGLKIEPRYASYYNTLAIIAGLKGDNKAEFELYKKAVSYDFCYAAGHLNMAILYHQYFDNPKDALVEARIALALDPTPRHLSQVILIYSQLGNTVKAGELETKLLNMKDIDAGTLNDLGLMYYRSENYKKAEMYFRKAIKSDPRLSNAHNNLGIILASSNRYDEALVSYNKAIEINPNYANAYSNLGMYYTDKKDYPKAISNLNKAIQLNPSLYRPYQNLGRVYILMGDLAKGKQYYQKAVDLGDKDPIVIRDLKQMSQ